MNHCLKLVDCPADNMCGTEYGHLHKEDDFFQALKITSTQAVETSVRTHNSPS